MELFRDVKLFPFINDIPYLRVLSLIQNLDPSGDLISGAASGYKDEFTTDTPLLAGQSFSSGIVFLDNYKSIATEIFSDQDGTLLGEWYDEDDNLLGSFTLPYDASKGLSFTGSEIAARYLKYTFTNTSGSDQTKMLLKLRLLNETLNGQIFPLDSLVPPGAQSVLAKSVLAGLDSGTGQYTNIDLINGSLKVFLTNDEGSGKIVYSEVNSLAAGSSALLLSYTVPVNKVFKLKSLYMFGKNLGAFEIIAAGDTITKTETYYTRYDKHINYSDLEYTAGQVIALSVQNKSANSPADYTAALQGVLFDA